MPYFFSATLLFHPLPLLPLSLLPPLCFLTSPTSPVIKEIVGGLNGVSSGRGGLSPTSPTAGSVPTSFALREARLSQTNFMTK